jgi:cytoskeleton-associated protein 5
MAEVEVKGPLEERVVHKNWKARLAAYEELEKIFREAEDGDHKFNEHGTCKCAPSRLIKYVGGYWKSIISDNNAAAQEKGLDALLAWLDRAKDAVKYASSMLL